MPKPRKDGRVLLAVSMKPEELDDFDAYATFHGRSKSEQARRDLLGKVTIWRRRHPSGRKAARKGQVAE